MAVALVFAWNCPPISPSGIADGAVHECSRLDVAHRPGMPLGISGSAPMGTPLGTRVNWRPAGAVVEVVAVFDNSFDNIKNPDPWSDVTSGPAGETLEGWLEYSLNAGR